MRRVVWRAQARDDFRESISYLIERDALAARLVSARIKNAVALLAERPIGRPSRMPGVFQKLVLRTPYILAYTATETELTILRVIHQSRDWSTDEWPRD